ncbi:MAG: 50S ribosomal protein L25/general stress protein Ctc [Cytophagales bacterium]|jgi:large subunit ribosomal protein L25|nr:50S ribosomal protein L25/general stress protein Ctc [Cytophagales bacterium]MCA6368612.1 50S ribosomal protein L25/general stress protein Ctc [Cytophagales bacterium]MCA6370226.1 50S ribosomal protein L25/general stress protein Ctc [Cytophagales bacterium]MCA6381769.1 50S ribosomal protein L25/general stress protein Ctc [Cytophagales bacterium]MCA6385106.1 50S ribosomal protein L25/general stress protein Ctc [Cytophagales bacterium]
MKTIEIIGYRRANLGKTDSQKIREEGNVPCVLYGGNDQIHFYSPVILFRDLVYTNEAHFVHLNIEGEECQAIMQEIQFHPVSEIILHVDFLRITDARKIKMDIPVRLVGQAPGVAKGGALVRKRASLKIYGFAKDMPDHVDVDCSSLDFHHAVKVGDMKMANLEFLDPKMAAIASVEVPRAAKLAEEAPAATPAAGAAAAPAAGAAAPAADAKKAEAPKKDEKKK